MSDSLQPHGLQHTRPPCPSPMPGIYSHSCPLSRWCHTTISSSVVPFSSHLPSFPASGSLPMSQFFASGGRSTGASASVLSVNIQGWLPLGLTGLISLLSKLLSGVFSSTTLHLVLDSVLNGCGTIQGVSVFLLQPILMHLIFLESYSFLSFHIYENIFLFITFIRSF